MKNDSLYVSKRTWIRAILIVVLFLIVGFSIMGEKVACNEGIGWDGQNYYTTMQRFVPMIKHHGYDQYAIRRIMPWGITNVVCALAGVAVTKEIAITSGVVYNLAALILSVIFFFRISNLKNWKSETEIIGFSLLFYTLLVLKIIGYYPVQTDLFAMTLGIMLCYYFFANKRWALIVLGFAGATIWPSSPVCAFALAFFPRKEIPMMEANESKIFRHVLYALFIIISCLPLMVLANAVFEHQGHVMEAMRSICPLTIPISEWIIPLTCLCACLFYGYLISAFKVSLQKFFKSYLVGKENWINYLLFVACSLLVSLVSNAFANEDTGLLTASKTIEWITMTSLTDPFVFVESHFAYFGLAYLLLLFAWRDIAKIVMKQGLGFMFIVALWILFSIRPEARVSIMYYVFPVMALLMHLNTVNVRKSAIAIIASVSLLMSRFWYPFNVEGMDKYLSWENYEKYIEFPAQRYFMYFGHWQSHEMYYIMTTVTIIACLILYAGIKKKWFVN